MSADLTHLRDALAGAFDIQREIGVGGMATVYLAHDVKHDRDVAVKVLHPDLGAALGGERFLSEIRTTARLQHPHILPLLDSGVADGLLYYVMPVVTGESLRRRLERERQLPIADAVRIAREVASALDYAHRQGVIHRDIKPENILLHDGQALVADFGIALAVQQAGGQRMTQTGLSLGTPQYMSPEQAMGERTIDARADIYALGAVTYEMLAGDAPFIGSSVQAIVAKVLTERPTPLHTVRDTVPDAVEQAVLTALAKLPADRQATAADFAAALSGQSSTGESYARRSAARRRGLRDPLVLGLAAVAMALAATLVFVVGQAPSDAGAFPARMELASAVEQPTGPAALSPDGHLVVFVARTPGARIPLLYLRRLDQLTSRAIPGTDDPSAPVFSADGKSIAFISRRRKLMKVALDGGAPVPLADVPDNGGVDWSARGDIVVGPGIMEGGDGLFRVNPAGGPLVPLTHVDASRKELSHEFPRILADGKTVVFSIWYGAIERSELAATSLDGGKVVPLGILGAKALGVAGGRLVYVRADGMVMAVPFDVGHLRPLGEATPVQDSVRMWEGSGGDVNAYLTHAGGLVYAHGAMNRRLLWVDRNGVARPALDDRRDYRFVRLSPDGRRIALTIATGARTDLWIFDVSATTLTRLTSVGSVRNPVWSSDGRRVLYVSTQGGRAGFWWQPADGSGPAVKTAEARHNPWWIDLSRDGRSVAFNSIYDGTFNLEVVSLDSTREEHDLAASPAAAEVEGRFSPDGRSLAYQSDESGRFEIYVRPFPESGSRVQVSIAGGKRPIWSPDGKRLYFWEGTRLMSATLARDPALRALSRDAMFDGQYENDFDISNDGARFVMIESEASGLGLVAVPNWLTELRQLTATKKGP